MLERKKELLPKAKELRKNMTPLESKLWYQFLRRYPVKIYKQRIIGSYIADFYCDKVKLVIEIDGSQHYEPEKAEYDARRTEDLRKMGIDVIRFSNREVSLEFSNVCEHIHNTIMDRLGHNPYLKETH